MIFLWITITTTIDDEIHPSITGLSDLYEWQYETFDLGGMYDRLAPRSYPLRYIDLVFHVLSGISPARSYPSSSEITQKHGSSLALVGAGICVYYYALETPNLSVELISKLRCVRGYIAHSGAQFKNIVGLTSPASDLRPLEIGERFNNLSLEIVVQENENESQLEVAYLIRYNDLNDMHNGRWLNLVVLFRELRALTKFVCCSGHFKSQVSSPHLVFNRNMLREAQEVINNEDFNSDTWIVTSIFFEGSRKFEKELGIAMESYFFLYLSLAIGLPNQRALCILPAIKCLTCILDIGCWEIVIGAPTAKLRITTINKSVKVLQ